MDDTFDTNKKWLLKPITSVVVITLMAGFFFSVPQTYALGTNENLPATLDQNYQQTSKLSDFVQKVFSFFAQETWVKNSIKSNIVNNTSDTTTQENLCKEDKWLAFIDIQDSEYKEYITVLYNKWIIVWSSNKFFPDDDLRFYCMIKILVNAYRSKVWYDINTEIWLSQKNYFTNASADIDKIFLKYLNTAYELWFLSWINDFDISSKLYFDGNSSYKTTKHIFKNINKQFPLLVDWLTIDNILDSDNIITRWKYTEYIVKFFEFKPSHTQSLCPDNRKYNFSDIMNHDYKEDIQVLANLWIINSQAYKFYPDNFLRNYEFIIMLTKTILKKENQDLNIYVLDHTANISDLDPKSSYIKYYEYAYHNWFLSYGFNPETWQPSVHPNQFITIKEINRTISKLVGKEIDFKVKSNDGLVTRWEFADMLVDWFSLDGWADNYVVDSIENTKLDKTWLLLQKISSRLWSSKLLSKL